MRPILFVFPLPGLMLPFGSALAALALVMLAVALFGLRGRAWDLVTFGAGAAVALVFLAFRYRGARLHVGGIPLYSYGAFLSTSLVLGVLLAQRLAKRNGVPVPLVTSAAFAITVGGVLGARLLYVLTNLDDFSSIASVLAFQGGGLVYYGAVLGGTFAAYLYLRKKDVSFRAFADVSAPALALGAGLGRLGCYSAGCDYGVPLSASAPHWLARLGTFPRWPDGLAGGAQGSPAWVDHVAYRGLSPDSTASLPVHPTQLYESFAAFILLYALLRLFRVRRFDGEVFLAFIAAYGALRFLLEMLRDDPERGTYGPSGSPAFVFSAALLVMATAFALGLAQVIPSRPARLAAITFSYLVPVLVFVALRGSSVADSALSTSQWIALVTSVCVAAAARASGGVSRGGPGRTTAGPERPGANGSPGAENAANTGESAREASFTGGTVSS